MRVRIHRGTKEIGGTCIELEAQGKRIALDVGLPLDAPRDEESHQSLLPAVPGFREADDTLLAVVISHPHMDHYGLARHIRPSVPVHATATHRHRPTTLPSFLGIREEHPLPIVASVVDHAADVNGAAHASTHTARGDAHFGGERVDASRRPRRGAWGWRYAGAIFGASAFACTRRPRLLVPSNARLQRAKTGWIRNGGSRKGFDSKPAPISLRP